MRPDVVYMYLTLRSGLADGDVLGEMVKQFGPVLFWKLFEQVLSTAISDSNPQRFFTKQPQDISPVLQAAGKQGLAQSMGFLTASADASLPERSQARENAFWAGRAAAVSDAGGSSNSRLCRLLTRDLDAPERWIVELINGDQMSARESDLSASSSTDGAYAAEKEQYLRTHQSIYFKGVDKAKQATYGRDFEARQRAYLELLRLAYCDINPREAFADLLPFYVERMTNEQENVRTEVFAQLFGAPGHDRSSSLPLHLWVPNLQHIRQLWQAAKKSRGAGWDRAWQHVGHHLVVQSLKSWVQGAGPNEACLFAIEVSNIADLNLPNLYHQENERRKQAAITSDTRFAPIPAEAAKWIFETVVPLQGSIVSAGKGAGKAGKSNDSTHVLIEFWKTLQTMALTIDGAERTAWQSWPFVQERWAALLGLGMKQSFAEFILVGLVDHLIRRQEDVAEKIKDKAYPSVVHKSLWWEPLDSPVYQSAVDKIFAQIANGEIPIQDSCALIVNRIRALRVRQRMTQSSSAHPVHVDINLPVSMWHNSWLKASGCHKRVSSESLASEEAVLTEIKLLSKVLGIAASGRDRRQVLWRIVQVASIVRGKSVDGLLREAIGKVDARLEGMGRCISRQFPYVKSALSFQCDPNSSSDVLTPLVTLYLSCADKDRDDRITEIMNRTDAHYFLFFGDHFAEHLGNMRQEWLHACILKLTAPTSQPLIEFYHYINQVPTLTRIAMLSKGWRTRTDDIGQILNASTLTRFWHPRTQETFLQMALFSTDKPVLSLIPCLEYVDGISAASELLAAAPREQKGAVEDAWAVVRPTGNFEDPIQEVERCFAELDLPCYQNSISDPEVEQILISLGRADNAMRALSVLGEYAGKVKRAKEAVVNAVPNLSPAQARTLIKEVMFGPKAGISLQVAALRVIADLQIPKPLELYRVAWRDGKCHRDIAANILCKVATAPVIDFEADEAQTFFDIFDRGTGADSKLEGSEKYPSRTSVLKDEDLTYVGVQLLNVLRAQSNWTFSFLPRTVLKLAMVPTLTPQAVAALLMVRNHVTEALGAINEVLSQARIASTASGCLARIQGQQSQEMTLLQDLSQFALGPKPGGQWRNLVTQVKDFKLGECEATVLRAFLLQLMNRRREVVAAQQMGTDSDVLSDILEVWLRLLNPWASLDEQKGVLIEIESWVLQQSAGVKDLTCFANVLSKTLLTFSIDQDRWANLLALARGIFQRLISKQLMPLIDNFARKDVTTELGEGPAHKRLKSSIPQFEEAASGALVEIVVRFWPQLVAKGASSDEMALLFDCCPVDHGADLVSTLVNCCISNAKVQNDKVRDEAHLALQWYALGGTRSKFLAAGKDGKAYAETLNTLASLWPGVVARDVDTKRLQVALELFPCNPPFASHVEFVKGLLKEASISDELVIFALRWLAAFAPQEALSLWSCLLCQKNGRTPEYLHANFKEFLELCMSAGLDPAATEIQTRGQPESVLNLLASSPLPSAQTFAVKALQERLDAGSHGSIERSLLQVLSAAANTPVVLAAVAHLSKVVSQHTGVTDGNTSVE